MRLHNHLAIIAGLAFATHIALDAISSVVAEERPTRLDNQEELSDDEQMIAELRRLALEADGIHEADIGSAAGLAMSIEELDAMTTLPGNIGPLPTVPPYPVDNEPTPERIELGRKLFFDLRLSRDTSKSCASCHDPQRGWGDDLPRAVGFGGRELGRHTPTIINSVFNGSQFWDGRANTLEEQAIGPMLSPMEMNMSSAQHIVDVVQSAAEYDGAFEQAYGGPATLDRIAKAIASFERTIITGPSRFDRYVKGDKSALSESEKRGLILFVTKGSCTACHNGPNFSDGKFHSLGSPQNGPLAVDNGRFEITGLDADRFAFKTPGLRNLEMTAPYMHDGSLKTLEEVVEFYARGGDPTRNRSNLMKPITLTANDKTDLIAFLKSLSGDLPNIIIPIGKHFGI